MTENRMFRLIMEDFPGIERKTGRWLISAYKAAVQRHELPFPPKTRQELREAVEQQIQKILKGSSPALGDDRISVLNRLAEKSAPDDRTLNG